MTQDNNTNNVTSEPILNDSDLSMDELGNAFEQLSNNYDLLNMKILKLKKDNKILQNKLNVF